MNKNISLPGLFLESVKRFGDSVALRRKDFGIWQEISWNSYLDHVKWASMAFISLGLKRNDVVAVLSENREEWIYSDIGCQAAGGICAGVYPTNPPFEVEYILGHSEAIFCIVEDQEQADKVLEVKGKLKKLRKVIVIDPKGMRKYKDSILMTYKDFEEIGKKYALEHPDLFNRNIASIDENSVAIMIYTSGTTGPPKGAMLSHKNVVKQSQALVPAVFDINEKDRIVSYLPLCHGAEQIMSIYVPFSAGCTVNFAESINTVTDAIYEIAPTIFFGVPRIWEKMHSAIEMKIKDSIWLKRFIYRFCLSLGHKVNQKRIELREKSLPITFKAIYLFAYFLCFRSILDKLGFLECKMAISGSAPISPEVLKFFQALGLHVKEGYGQTEIAGFSFCQQGNVVKPGYVGKPIPGIEVKLAPDGEILERSEQLFVGYFKDPEATKNAIDEEKWLHSGDIGEFDKDGDLRIIDRKKDILITAGGKNIAPSEIENQLRFSPFIKEAVVIGDKRKFLSALIQIDYEETSKWALDRKIAFTTYKSLALNPDVYDLIKDEIKNVNSCFSRVENIRKFCILEKELDHDDAELTATQKVKRANIIEKYSDLVEEMYH